MKDLEGFRKLMISEDIWVVDHGIREVEEKFETMGYKVFRPDLREKRIQLK